MKEATDFNRREIESNIFDYVNSCGIENKFCEIKYIKLNLKTNIKGKDSFVTKVFINKNNELGIVVNTLPLSFERFFSNEISNELLLEIKNILRNE